MSGISMWKYTRGFRGRARFSFQTRNSLNLESVFPRFLENRTIVQNGHCLSMRKYLKPRGWNLRRKKYFKRERKTDCAEYKTLLWNWWKLISIRATQFARSFLIMDFRYSRNYRLGDIKTAVIHPESARPPINNSTLSTISETLCATRRAYSARE